MGTDVNITAPLMKEVAELGTELYDMVCKEVAASGVPLTQEQMRTMNDLRAELARCKARGII